MQTIKLLQKFTVFITFFSFLSAHAETNAGDTKKQFLDLVEKSASHKSACQTYNDELSKVAVTEIKPGQELYKDRETALAVIKKLESHPGTPEESYKAFKLLYKFKESDFAEDWLLQSLERIEYFCNIFHYYHHLKNLILNREHYKFTDEDMARVRLIIFKFVEAESQNPNLAISSMMQVGFLDLLNQLKMLAKGKDYSADLKALHQQGELVRDKFLKTSSKDKKSLGKQLYMEFTESKMLAGGINNLYKKIKSDIK